MHNTYWRKEEGRAKTSFKKYTSHFIARFACERELETEQNCNILTSPAPPDIAVCRSCSPGLLNRGPGGPASLGHVLIPASSHQLVWSPNSLGVPRAPSAGWWLSLPHLVSNSSDLQLADFLSPPSYIIVHSPTQSLEWHVWSSSSGNNCHVVHRSLSSGAPVYECIMGFYLVPFRQPNPSTRFLLITAIGMCHLLPVHHFGMAYLAGSKVNIKQKQQSSASVFHAQVFTGFSGHGNSIHKNGFGIK